MASADFDLTRMWGAVWTEDGPVAEVRDVADRATFEQLLDADDFRWFYIAALEDWSGRGHSRRTCAPGAPCKKCQKTAPAWWFEHGRRTKARLFRPCHPGAKRTNAYSVDDWGKKFDRYDDALAAARQGGFPLICLVNGHGRSLEWFDVPPVAPAPGQVALFAPASERP